jgi:hypothetical protein
MKKSRSRAPENILCLKIIHLVNRAARGDSASVRDDAGPKSLVLRAKQLRFVLFERVSVSLRLTVRVITVSAHRQLKTLTDPD